MTDKNPVLNEASDEFKAREKLSRAYFAPSDHILLRIDGRAFHTYTKKMERPFDKGFNKAMTRATMALCRDISGVRFAYTQSDEISLLIKARGDREELFMGGEQNKLVSLSASIATAAFLKQRFEAGDDRIAHFDSRAFTVGTTDDVFKYFLWRHMDCTKNSVSMLAHSEFGHKALLNVSTEKKKIMLADNNTPWEHLSETYRFGTMFYRERIFDTVRYVDKRTNTEETAEAERAPFVEHAARYAKFFPILSDVLENGEIDSRER